MIRRVMIFGGSGSGKSTLARRLSVLTGLPVSHMDHMYWQAGWVQRPPDQVLALALDAAQGEAWIIEGNHSPSMDDRASRADVLIWLDVPTSVRLRRVLWRGLRYYGRSRPDLTPGCRERFDYGFLRDWVIPYGGPGPTSGRSRAADFVRQWSRQRPVVTLRSGTEARRFLDRVASVGLGAAVQEAVTIK